MPTDGRATIYDCRSKFKAASTKEATPYLRSRLSQRFLQNVEWARSAAVSAAWCAFDFLDATLPEETLWDIVQGAETISHGNPSGVDTATTSEHVLYFSKEQELKR